MRSSNPKELWIYQICDYLKVYTIFDIYLYEQYASHITEENEKQKEEINALNGDIKELTTSLVSKKGRRGTGKDADLAVELENLEEEFGRVRDKLSREQTEISKLREKLADSEAYRTQALSAKSESDAKVVEQGKRIDDLGKELLKAISVTKNAEILTKESNKVKGDTVKETKRLLEENEHLQNEVLINQKIIVWEKVFSKFPVFYFLFSAFYFCPKSSCRHHVLIDTLFPCWCCNMKSTAQRIS